MGLWGNTRPKAGLIGIYERHGQSIHSPLRRPRSYQKERGKDGPQLYFQWGVRIGTIRPDHCSGGKRLLRWVQQRKQSLANPASEGWTTFPILSPGSLAAPGIGIFSIIIYANEKAHRKPDLLAIRCSGWFGSFHKSSGMRPVCLAIFASIFGPISSRS